MNNKEEEETSGVVVDGIVARRDHQPYVRLIVDGKATQLSLAEARKIANDIVVQASRSEADAMIHKFFERAELPPGAGDALMLEFREYRRVLDAELVEGWQSDPETGERKP